MSSNFRYIADSIKIRLRMYYLRISPYILTVIYHEIISMFPYSDGRCAIFTK
jgi:hypothetical protein